jgi:hypothetical protein
LRESVPSRVKSGERGNRAYPIRKKAAPPASTGHPLPHTVKALEDDFTSFSSSRRSDDSSTELSDDGVSSSSDEDDLDSWLPEDLRESVPSRVKSGERGNRAYPIRKKAASRPSPNCVSPGPGLSNSASPPHRKAFAKIPPPDKPTSVKPSPEGTPVKKPHSRKSTSEILDHVRIRRRSPFLFCGFSGKSDSIPTENSLFSWNRISC